MRAKDAKKIDIAKHLAKWIATLSFQALETVLKPALKRQESSPKPGMTPVCFAAVLKRRQSSMYVKFSSKKQPSALSPLKGPEGPRLRFSLAQ